MNDYGKFDLFLDNPDFAAIYYLIKYKIEMKSDTMTSAADFTPAANEGNITLGEMIFKLPMVIVGDHITVSAIATLSTTSERRRMMSSETPKATFAATDVGVIERAKAANTGLQTYIFSIVLFFGMMLIMI